MNMDPNEYPLYAQYTGISRVYRSITVEIIMTTYIDIVYYIKLQVPCFERALNEL